MIINGTTASGSKVRGRNASDDFFVSYTPTKINNAPSFNNATTVKEATYNNYTASSYQNAGNISITTPSNNLDSPIFTNLTPSVATLDANGNITNVISNGTQSTQIKVPGVGTKIVSTPVSTSAVSNNTSSFSGWLADNGAIHSVANHIQTAILNMVSGKSSALQTWNTQYGNNRQNVLTSNNNTISTPVVTRNSNLFTLGTGGVDTTGISVMTTGQINSLFPLVLIYANTATTTDYIAFGGHVGYSIGTQVVWADNSSNYYTGTITNALHITCLKGDNWLYKLSFPSGNKPNTIIPFKLMPTNWANYMPTVGTVGVQYDLPVLASHNGGDKWQLFGVNQNGSIVNMRFINIMLMRGLGINGPTDVMSFDGMQHWYNGPFNNPSILDPNITKTSIYEPLRTWSWDIISGDSNGPIFVPIDPNRGTNYQPVLLHCTNFTFGSNGGGAFYPSLWAEGLAAELESLVTGSSTAVQISLSNFSTF